MVLARTNDSAVEAFCPKERLRFLYADVSATVLEALGCNEKLDGTSFYRDIALD